MSFTIAEQDYIRAIDNYPYNLEVAIENLNYALSYSRDHAGVISLMGRLYFKQLRDFETVEFYFVNALGCDSNNLDTYE